MQTFLPSSNFEKTAVCLDRQRLGNQRSEAKVILRTLLGESSGWRHHPAVKMWRGHELALCQYGMAICCEWRRRGYVDNQLNWFVNCAITLPSCTPEPAWLGDGRLHSSHRAALLEKNYAWYSQFGWEEEPGINYYWPEVAR